MDKDQLQARLRDSLLQVKWQVARLGNAGKTGMGLLVVAIIFFLVAVLPKNASLDELKAQVQSLQNQALSSASGASVHNSTKKIGGDQALQIFYDFFPRIDSSPFWIKELTNSAKRHGVEINSSDYRLVHEQGYRLARYEMILPVRGRYRQIRAFIADALQVVPAMAITGMVIKRDNVQTEQLDARLEINLYLH